MSGIGYKRTYGTPQNVVWQGTGKDIQLAQGGFLLDRTGFPDGTIIPAGTPMSFDESARTAKPLVTAVIYANAGSTDTTYQVKKGHLLQVGNYFALIQGGGKAYAITVIDTTNANYDVITVGTTIGAATAGDMAFASTATGATSSNFGFTSKNGGLNYRDVVCYDGTPVSVVIRGTVYARRVPYSAGLEAALPKIIYSQSK